MLFNVHTLVHSQTNPTYRRAQYIELVFKCVRDTTNRIGAFHEYKQSSINISMQKSVYNYKNENKMSF